VLMVFKQ